MKLIVAGSRYTDETQTEKFEDYEWARGILDDIYFQALANKNPITEVVCGKAIGADTMGERWATEVGITVAPFPVTKADWQTYGRGAGHKRNRDMGDYADAAIILWNGVSKGSLGMKEYMDKLNKPVLVYTR